MILSIAWPRAPKPVSAVAYLLLGWMGAWFFPGIAKEVGATTVAWICAGGVLYSAGALAYALRKPDPWPRVFGYHEIFHALVIVAAGCHFLAVTQCLRSVARG